MKTRILLAGVAVAAISAFSLTAKAQEQPLVKIVPGTERTIKLIFEHQPKNNVSVKFSDADGLISADKINASSYDRGFIKKYQVNRNKADAFWVHVTSKDMDLTYKLTAEREGQWTAQLEKATYNYQTVASR